jgi:hypothetical protein
VERVKVLATVATSRLSGQALLQDVQIILYKICLLDKFKELIFQVVCATVVKPLTFMFVEVAGFLCLASMPIMPAIKLSDSTHLV